MAKKLYEETDIQNIANSIRSKNGSSDTYKVSEMSTAIDNIESGGGSGFTGHVDEEGLRALGWTSDEIQEFKDNIWWDEEYDYLYKLKDSEKVIVGNDVNNYTTRYIDSTCTKKTYESMMGLLAVPNISVEDNYNTLTDMFGGCYNLLYVPYCDTSNIITAIRAFRYCRNIKRIPNFDFSNASYLTSAFQGCSALAFIKDIDISKCESLEGCFNTCSSLNTVSFVAKNNYNASMSLKNAFSYCYCLKSIDMSKINKKINDVSYAFNYCYSLELIDIRGLICSGITSSSNYQNALTSVYSAKVKIIVKDDTEKSWWQSKFSTWKDCFYTVEEAIAAGIVDE